MLPSRSSAAVVCTLAACGGPQRPAAPSCPTDRTVVLAAQDDVAAIAGCTALSALTIRSAAAIDLTPLGQLASIRGDLTVGPTLGLDELKLSELRTVGGAVWVASNNSLRGVFLPRLERAGRISIEANVSLASVSMPQLAAVDGTVSITGNNDLEIVDIGALASIGRDLVIADNGSLSLVEAERLRVVGDIRIDNNRTLPAETVEELRGKKPSP